MQVRLLVSSYTPLFALLAIRIDGIYLQSACALIAAIGIAFAYSLTRIPSKEEGHPINFRRASPGDEQVAAHLATYLLPFLMTDTPTVRDIIAYALFLIIISIIFIRGNLLQVNPVLALAGYRLYSASSTTGWNGFALSRSRIETGTNYLAFETANGGPRLIRPLEDKETDSREPA